MTENEYRPPVYGHWFISESVGYKNYGLLPTIFGLATLFIISILCFSSQWVTAFIVVMISFPIILLSTYKDFENRPIYSKIAARISFNISQRKRRNVFKGGIMNKKFNGKYILPGIGNRINLKTGVDIGGQEFGYFENNYQKTFSIVLHGQPEGQALMDNETIDRFVNQFSTFLNAITKMPGIIQIKNVLEITKSDSVELENEINNKLDKNAPDISKQMLNESKAILSTGSYKTDCYVEITYSYISEITKRTQKKQILNQLKQDLPRLKNFINFSGGGAVEIMNSYQLCKYVRCSFDPQSNLVFQNIEKHGEQVKLNWSKIGPSGAETFWDKYRHDSGTSVSWMLYLAPESPVFSTVLRPLLRPEQDITIKRISTIYIPVKPIQANKLIQTAQKRANNKQSATSFEHAKLVTNSEILDRDKQQGAAILKFGMLVTATILDESKKDEIEATIKTAGISSNMGLRQCYGSQDSAFMAALPLGVILNKYSHIPQQIKENL
ncbi:MAG: hypothetical protein LBT99_03265 [Bifidobacteriaceae bacterium]|jgi:hypothetical protein|nr:hypothetical protein [Bifidobacteriaceae bacterium]